MRDQADTLRRLMQERAPEPSRARRADGGGKDRAPAKVLTIASGKGGVGKSVMAANLGAALARSGLRVLLVDGDFGLANLDILLGVQPTVTLEQVLDGEARIQDAILGIEPNLWLMPASSGLMSLREADAGTRIQLMNLFDEFPWEMDLVIVDAGAGIQRNVLSLHNPSYESVVVLTPEPTSLTDAYSLIKLLRRHSGVGRVGVIVNQVTDAREARKVFMNLKEVSSRFMDVGIEFLGHVQRDEKFTQSVLKRKILLDLDHGAAAVPCLELLAKRLSEKLVGDGGTARSSQSSRELGQSMDQSAGLGSVGMRFDRVASNAAVMAAMSNPGNLSGFWRNLLGEVKA